MRRAMSLAEKGRGHVNPNPLVGAVIVREGHVTGEGWHRRYGDLHAEKTADSCVAAENARLRNRGKGDFHQRRNQCASCEFQNQMSGSGAGFFDHADVGAAFVAVRGLAGEIELGGGRADTGFVEEGG